MLVVENVSGGTVILMINDAVELPQVASVTVTLRADKPDAAGVPKIVPPEAIRPGGRLPDMDQVGEEHTVPLQVAKNV